MKNSRRLFITGLTCVAGLLIPLTATATHAHASACRSDPVVWLSNGHKVQIASQIAADPSTVSDVAYALHVPPGVKVTKIVYTQGPIGRLEHIEVTANSSSGKDYAATATLYASQTLQDSTSMQLVNQVSGWNETLNATTTTNQSVTIEETNAQ